MRSSWRLYASAVALAVIAASLASAIPQRNARGRAGRGGPSEELHVVVAGSAIGRSNGNLWHTIRRANGWQPWGDIEAAASGTAGVVSQVATALTSEGLQVVVLSDRPGPSGSNLWHTVRFGDVWQAWGDVEGAVQGDIGTITQLAAATVDDELHLVALGSKAAPSGGHLWHTIRHANGWQAWGDVEGAVPGDNSGDITHLAVAGTREGLHILVVANGRRGSYLLHTLRRDNGWQSWGDVESAVPGDAGEISLLTAAGTREGLQVVVVGSRRGNSRGYLWHTVRTGNSWQPWGDVEGAVAGDIGEIASISATSVRDELHLLAVSRRASRNGSVLWHTVRQQSGWQPWGDVEGAVDGDAGPVLALASSGTSN